MDRKLAAKLLEALNHATHPLNIEELCQKIGASSSRRTVIRRLEQLQKDGIVTRTGRARATCYQLRRDECPLTEPRVERSVANEETPLENQDEVLQRLRNVVRQPQGLRRPASYQREFLDDYRPNVTAYLPDELRTSLHEIGQSRHMAEMPPGTYARQVLNRLIIDLSWNSSRLEGSTYSLLETEHLLGLGRSSDPVRSSEAQMILNHKTAIEFLVEEPGELAFNRYTLLNLHAILTEGLLKNRRAEGALRQIPVGISGTVYHPVRNPLLIEECFDLILQKAGQIDDPFECSFFLMVHLPYLQPFEDGNKRTSRLISNLPLVQRNIAPLSFTGVPVRDYTDGIIAVYELNRIELLRDVFVRAYERSAGRYATIRQEIGEPDAMHARYRNEIKDQVREVVVRRLDKLSAAAHLRDWARREITASDREALLEVIEERLLELNEGNIARVRVRPSEFHAWTPVWMENRA